MKRTILVITLLAILVVSCLVLTACHSCEFREWIVIKQATCTEAGLKVQVCECGESRTEIIPATGHSYTSVVTNPTCTKQGYTTHTCDNCDVSYVDSRVEATTHDFQTFNWCNKCRQNITDVAVDSFDMSATTDDNVMGYVVLRQDGKYDAYIKGSGDMINYSFIATDWLSPFFNYAMSCVLANVYIENGVTSIGDFAFWGCDSLTSIIIPASMTTIGESAFSGCCYLAEVYNYSSLNITKGSKDYGSVAYYALDVYTTDEPSRVTADEYGFVIHTNGDVVTLVRYIGGATEIIIPNSVTTIGNFAFNNCSGVTSITIPDSVTTIGSYAFESCISLTSVTFDENSQLTTIGDGAFAGCDKLTRITIPEGVTTIGSNAFYKCYSLIGVTIPQSVTCICPCAFYLCSNLTSVTFENTNAWYVTLTEGATSGTNLTLTNASTNANYLKSTYYYYYWYKNN